MYFLNTPKSQLLSISCLQIVCLTSSLALIPKIAFCEEGNNKQAQSFMVPHLDPVVVDATLTLPKLIDATMQKFPDVSWLTALEEEAVALAERGQSWTAGASQATVGYQSMSTFKLNYGTANVQVPLWNLGQRDAQNNLANKVETSADLQSASVKLRVAGLVRVALWAISLANIRHDQAKAELAISEKLLATIKRRVESGDLPRADELLAQTELLQKRSVLTQAEAELMHARKRYTSITQLNKYLLTTKSS